MSKKKGFLVVVFFMKTWKVKVFLISQLIKIFVDYTTAKPLLQKPASVLYLLLGHFINGLQQLVHGGVRLEPVRFGFIKF